MYANMPTFFYIFDLTIAEKGHIWAKKKGYYHT